MRPGGPKHADADLQHWYLGISITFSCYSGLLWLTHDGLGDQPDARAEQEAGGGTGRNWLIIVLFWFTNWLTTI
jgi:hypothetical protein